MYICPDDPYTPDSIYAVNEFLGGIAYATHVLSQIKRAERTFVFIEGKSEPQNSHVPRTGGNLRRSNGSYIPPTYPYPALLNESSLGSYHKLGASNGTPISFADGHVIFWQYARPVTAADRSADVFQLEAWNGRRGPPGAMQ